MRDRHFAPGALVLDYGGGEPLPGDHTLAWRDRLKTNLQTPDRDAETGDATTGGPQKHLSGSEVFERAAPVSLLAHVADQLQTERFGADRREFEAEGLG